ncbi:MAG: hypothetical protein U0R51_06520 [Solirubrobacterales bacterium]
MIIGERFAWAHLPKAAGTATQAMFEAVPGLIDYADPVDSNSKHDAFWVREDELAGKLLAMNLRRLPSWVLSAANHKAMSGLWPDFEPLPMPTVEEMVESTDPDDLLRWMTDGPRMPVDRWLRAEHLQEDVLGLLGELGVLTPAAREAVVAVPWVGKAYDHDVDRAFTAEQIARMYEVNPSWTAAERAAYGDLHQPSA